MHRVVIRINNNCNEFWEKYNGFYRRHDYDLVKHRIYDRNGYTVYESAMIVDGKRLVEKGYMREDTVEQLVIETEDKGLADEITRIAHSTPCVDVST